MRSGWRRPGRSDLADWLLIAEFTFISVRFYLPALLAGGLDARIYRLAALDWIAGRSPLDAHMGLEAYAAPPLTLLVVAPFAALPENIFVGLNICVAIASAVYVLRKLGRPAWWLLFPPLFECVVVGNLNLLVLAMLLAGRWWTDVIAALAKVYALVPIFLLGRRRSLVAIGVVAAVTVPFLPWGDYVSKAGMVSEVLIAQSQGGHSAWTYPWLIPVTLLALLVLGRKRMPWLAIPTMWPATQVHYSIFALPAMSRRMAAIMALPIPVAPVIAVLTEAALSVYRSSRAGAVGTGSTAESGPIVAEAEMRVKTR